MQENPDENLLVAVGDALPALAAALGPDTYAPIFAQQHAEALFKWMRGSQPDSVRAAGMGEQPHLPFPRRSLHKLCISPSVLAGYLCR